MDAMKISVKKLVIILLVSILIGTAALCLVYCLPVKPMQAHMSETIDAFVQEGDNPFLIPGYKGSSLDNYTDAVMLCNAVFESDAPFYKAAMTVARAADEEEENQQALQRYLSSGKADKVGTYARYWHGYLVILKPLLLLMNYREIRFLNGVVSAGVFLLAVWGFYKRGMKKGMAAFLFAAASLFPVTIPYSLQFSSVYYTGMLACLAVLYQYEFFEEKKSWAYFFFVTGICTSFLDFLTYPVFTFGMPLILYMAIRRCGLKEEIVFTVKSGICWCLGYVGMWGGKWAVGSWLTKENIWLDALGTVELRASGEVSGENAVRILAVLRNFYIYFNLLGFLLAGLLLLWVVRQLYQYKERVCLYQIGWLLGVACIPVIWYMAMANHSYIHYWYTFRSLSVSVFAVGMIPQMME
ncbi:MAG TPA: hypothetical protein DD414_10600 [Lachnospiraceae bacterium]|nr:hypothetical protein [Lachnospiraceae bacterium]